MCDEITVLLKDGRQLYRQVEFPRDKPDIGWPELTQKFHDLAAPYLTEEQIELALNGVGELEDCADIAEFMTTLRTN